MNDPLTQPVSLHLLDREFMVSCTEDEREGLLAAAALLNTKMRELRAESRTLGFDRIAVLAALNLTHELLQMRSRMTSRDQEILQSLGLLRNRLEVALHESVQ